MNHRNFHFTQIPDKTNDKVFLNSPETMLLDHFWPFWSFLPNEVFFQNILALLHTAIYGPLTPCEVSEKTDEPNLRKLTDKQKDGWRTHRPYFIGVCGQFPDWTVPQLTLPRGQFPDWHFPDGHLPNGHFPERTIPRPDTSPKDTSPTGHFPTKTFPRTDISLAITYFQISAFFSETFC